MSEEIWIKIQRKTFARWVNQMLQSRQLACSDELEQQLQDGVLLHNLLEITTGKTLPKINMKPRIIIQRIENLNKSLKFMQSMDIKLVGVGSEDIHDGRTKLVLGMIWTLILRFQLDSAEEEEDLGFGMRQSLLDWCNAVLNPQGISVRNFTENWKDGRAFCGLVNALEPGSIPLEERTPDKALENADLAFNRAHDLFKFPKFLDAEDLVQFQDELSIITYVSLFRAWLTKVASYPPNCYAEGEGLTHALTGKLMPFTVFAMDDKNNRITRGGAFLKCDIKDKNGKFVAPVKVKDNLDGTYSCSYETEKYGTKGEFVLNVCVGRSHIRDSPFHPEIIPGEADPSQCTAFGEGLEGAKAGETATFTVQSKDMKGDNRTRGGATVFGTVTDPSGKIPITVVDNNDGTYTCTYVPKTAGPVSVEVSVKTNAFGTATIQNSPFTVEVRPGEGSAAYTIATGPGTEGAVSGTTTDLTVQVKDKFGNTVKEGGAPVNGQVVYKGTDEDLPPIPIEVLDNGDGTYTLNYNVQKAGPYDVEIKVGDEYIKDAPFKIEIDPGKTSIENTDIKFAPRGLAGLTGATVQIKDSNMNLRFNGGDSVEAEFTPLSKEKVSANDNGDGTYDVVFPPYCKGEYIVDITVNGEPVPESPWTRNVEENPLQATEKQTIHKQLPKSAHVLERLIAKTTPQEREVLLKELLSFR